MAYFIIGSLFTVFFSYFILSKYFMIKRYLWKKKHGPLISIGFFHPYCNDGGGGERVLWTAVLAVQKRYSHAHCTVYTGDAVPAEEILKKVELNLNIKLLRPVEFVYLKSRLLVDAKYPYFTLLMQSLGSVILGLEAAFKHIPDVYIDTMGYAWTLPVFRQLACCRVAAYVHYPTISTDMLSTVIERMTAVHNTEFISQSSLLSSLKLIYYKMFAYLYGLMGRQAHIVMVNSSWTRGHILELWKKSESTYTVYPPCDVSQFENIPLDEKKDDNLRILSIAQFRPEKNHELQIKSFNTFLNNFNTDVSAVLVMIGSCRHEEDYARLNKLKQLSSELGIDHKIEFKVNLSFQEVISEMEKANVALHTMWNEHFGIGIVECMSAGLIMVAHNSGGPKMDIIQNEDSEQTGFLADSLETYSNALETIQKMNPKQLLQIRKSARQSASRFSVSKFEDSFLAATQTLFS